MEDSPAGTACPAGEARRRRCLDCNLGRFPHLHRPASGIAERSYCQPRLGWRPEDYPNATGIGWRTLSSPLSPKLTDLDAEDAICAVRAIGGA